MIDKKIQRKEEIRFIIYKIIKQNNKINCYHKNKKIVIIVQFQKDYEEFVSKRKHLQNDQITYNKRNEINHNKRDTKFNHDKNIQTINISPRKYVRQNLVQTIKYNQWYEIANINNNRKSLDNRLIIHKDTQIQDINKYSNKQQNLLHLGNKIIKDQSKFHRSSSCLNLGINNSRRNSLPLNHQDPVSFRKFSNFNDINNNKLDQNNQQLHDVNFSINTNNYKNLSKTMSQTSLHKQKSLIIKSPQNRPFNFGPVQRNNLHIQSMNSSINNSNNNNGKLINNIPTPTQLNPNLSIKDLIAQKCKKLTLV